MRKTLTTIVLALTLALSAVPLLAGQASADGVGTPIPVPAVCVPYQERALDFEARYWTAVAGLNDLDLQLGVLEDRVLSTLARVDRKKAKIHDQKRTIRHLRAQLAAS